MIYHGSSSTYSGHNAHFIDLEDAVIETTRVLEKHLDKFDSIVVQGVSGMAVGFPVALRLGKPILVARKTDEQSHSCGGELVNAGQAGKRVLFLDDFVSGGATKRRCAEAVRRFAKGARITKQYTYRDREFTSAGLTY